MARHHRLAGNRRLGRRAGSRRPRHLESLEARRVLDATLVFNELMYQPASDEEHLEWVELYNQMSVDLDVSDWKLEGGIDYQFPAGTIAPHGGYLVVAISPADLQAASGYAGALGPFAGRLDNGGEEIRLVNNSGRLVSSITYDDDGAWPVGPDGSGFALAKRELDSGADVGGNWLSSAQPGGSPGAENFPLPDLSPSTSQPISLVSDWRYNDTNTDLGTAWTDPNYDDSGWSQGPAVFHAGDDPATPALGLRYLPITGDADSGIASSKVYTHQLDFGNGETANGALINGVQFTRVNNAAALAAVPNFSLVNSSGTLSYSGANTGSNVTGGSLQLFQDYLTNTVNVANGTVTVTISGLTVGAHYDTRLYSRQLAAGTRNVRLEFDTNNDGTAEHQATINQDNAAANPPGLDVANRAYAISYDFLAQATVLKIKFVQLAFNRPWLMFGLTNEIIGGAVAAEPIATLFSTGIGDDGAPLAPGTPDPHWYQTATLQPVLAQSNHPAWLANSASSTWVSTVADGQTNIPPIDYSFSTQFDLSEYDSATASIAMLVAVDNSLTSVKLNGVSKGIATAGFASFNGPFTINSGFVPGMNTLELVWNNTPPGDNPGGLRVQLTATAMPMVNRTEVALGPNTHYFRQEFDFAGDLTDEHDLDLDMIVDDGAVVYLNGEEIYRHNMPAGPVSFGTAAASNVTAAARIGRVPVPAGALEIGRNVLAVEVHQFDATNNDLRFGAELFVTSTPVPPGSEPRPVINEMASAADANFWLELANPNDAAIDLGGYLVRRAGAMTTADYVLASEMLAPGAFRVLNEAELGFEAALDDRLFLLAPGGAAVADAHHADDALRGRSAQHEGDWLLPASPTPGATNAFDFHDEVVINEIMYHGRATPAVDLVTETTLPVSLSDTWRYDDSGTDLGTSWREPAYNDAGWDSGPGILYSGNFSIPAGNSRAGQLRYLPITADANSDISPAKTYTHALDFGANTTFPAASVNGVQFTAAGTGAFAGGSNNMTLSGSNSNHNAAGGLADLLGDFVYNTTSAVVTLTGLTVGQTYDLRLYTRANGTVAGDRRQLFQFNTDGVAGAENAISINTDNAAQNPPGFGAFNQVYALSYVYRAESTTLTLNIASATGTYQMYGLTNELTDRVPIGTLYSTGLAANRTPLAGGAVDPHYTLLPGAAQGTQAIAITNHPNWYGNDAGSGFVGVVNPGTTNVAAGNYDFRTTFDLTGLDTSTASLTLTMWVDNTLSNMLLNGQSTGISFSGFDLASTRTFTLTGPFNPGVNTLDFLTVNEGGVANPAGFRVNASGSAVPLPAVGPLAQGPNTYYFRKSFEFSGDPSRTTLELDSYVDDGAVYHLNGVEVYRQNLPAGAVSYATNAVDPVGSASSSGLITIPAGSLISGTNVLAVEVHQAVPDGGDLAFGASLRATETITDAAPFTESNEEWIELFNRSSSAVDLSGWTLDEVVDYAFAPGTTISAGGYLIVARDAAALAVRYPGIDIVGNYSGRLSNSSGRIVLKDAVGNPADEVRYFDGGRWAELADGEGPSLELKDPDADNSQPEAWAASDAVLAAPWQSYTYRGVAAAERASSPNNWQEFVIGMLGSGEVLLDDISVVESPAGAAVQRVQNGGFQADALGASPATWRIIGNHHGTVIDDPDSPGNKVLRLVATGPTEHMHNHGETTFAGGAAIANGTEYQISFKAKWISGSSQLNTRLYFNRLARTTQLDVADSFGTPGAQNSRYESNLGPTYADLQHGPVVPAANQAVTVSVTAADPDGVASSTLFYSVAGGAFASLPMTHLGDGRYSADIPGQAAASIVQFYVQAVDGLGAVSTFPAAGAASRALYKVQDNQALLGTLHNVRIIMTTADSDLMHTNTNVMSNQLMGATVVYDEREVYYDVGVRLKSSQRGRLDNNRVGFHLEFQPDQLFRGVHPVMLVDRSGGYGGRGGPQDEILLNHVMNRAGMIPAVYFDMTRVIAPRTANSGTALFFPRFEDVFADEYFDNGGDGTQFEYELIYFPLTNVVSGDPQSLKLPQPDDVRGTDLSDLGEDKEQYRWINLIKNHRDQDDYSRIIDLGQALSLTGTALDAAAQQVMDIDEWARVFALLSLGGVNDTYTQGLQHNLQIYVRPEDNLTVALPWDWDFAFSHATNRQLIGDSNLSKVFNLTPYRRLFYCHMLDLIANGYNTTYMTPWAAHYGSRVGQNYSGDVTYIGDRVSYVLTQIPSQTTPFQITTNGGADFSTELSSVALAGDAAVGVKTLRIQGRAGDLTLAWGDIDSWSTSVPLAFGENVLTVEGFDCAGNLVASDTITVTTTAGQPLQDALRVTELNYHPTDPTPAELAVDPTLADDDFEFLEIKNIGVGTVDLAGVKILGDVSFDFTGSAVTMLDPGQYLLVVESAAGFDVRYDTTGLNIAGEYTGNLSNGGNSLELRDALGQTIQLFTFDDNGPGWHPTTDGGGPTLVIVDPLAPVASWNDGPSWRPSYEAGGSPGADDVAPASVVGRQIFYNNSQFDGNNPAANASDDAAIASDKSALLPGQTATLANYTSYSKGINGLLIDVANLAGTPTAADFSFTVGNNNSVGSWPALATAPSISLRPGAGAGGSTRITLTWPDGTITKRWLQVTVLAGENTGLTADDVFYFGNAIGESGNTTADAVVNATDEIGARTHPSGPFPNASIANLYDFNRDRLVNATDQIIARTNGTNPLTALRLISVPAETGEASAAAGGALADAALAALADDGLASAAPARRRRR